jgi:hypothetical protein
MFVVLQLADVGFQVKPTAAGDQGITDEEVFGVLKVPLDGRQPVEDALLAVVEPRHQAPFHGHQAPFYASEMFV